MNRDALKLSFDLWQELLSPSERDQLELELTELMTEPFLDYEISKILDSDFPYSHSWIYAQGKKHNYKIFDILEGIKDKRMRSERYFRMLSTSNALMPIDVRAKASELWRDLNLNKKSELEILERLATTLDESRIRSLARKTEIPTDGIDHLFDIPDTHAKRLDLIRTATQIFVLKHQVLIAKRLLNKDLFIPRDAYRNREVEAMIECDVDSQLLKGSDFILTWDEEVCHNLTTAEIARIILLASEFSLPDLKTRVSLLGFYRAAFRLCGRAIIGLSAGIFHVEHGSLAAPSYFYMGRDAALGKGCKIDGVGGAVFLKESFAGGGFMPILIHTHKHIKTDGESAIFERKRIQPCIFLAEQGARFPMSAIGLYEAADFLQLDSPFQGIRSMPIQFDISDHGGLS